MEEKSIGVFDSGFGGLAILRNILAHLPQYHYVYFGDSARAPYGNRSQEEIYAFTQQAVDFLFAKNCGLIILACNTVSSEALRKIQQEYLPTKYPGKRVLGVVVPAAEEAVIRTKNKRVGVIATEATVSSQAFVREITHRDPHILVFQQACPLLVSLVEAGEHETPMAEVVLREYLAPLIEKDIDTLILGCTHYVFFEKKIRQIMGTQVALISEADVVTEKLEKYLSRHPEITSGLSKKGGTVFYTSDLTSRFKTLGSAYLGKPIEPLVNSR